MSSIVVLVNFIFLICTICNFGSFNTIAHGSHHICLRPSCIITQLFIHENQSLCGDGQSSQDTEDLLSSFEINTCKSNIYCIGLNQDAEISLASLMRYSLLSFSYLVYRSVGSSMNHIRRWNPFINVFNAECPLGKTIYYRLEGRFYFSLHKAPIHVTEGLERICKTSCGKTLNQKPT